MVQALTIFLVRTLTGENFSDFVNAMRITIQEKLQVQLVGLLGFGV